MHDIFFVECLSVTFKLSIDTQTDDVKIIINLDDVDNVDQMMMMMMMTSHCILLKNRALEG